MPETRPNLRGLPDDQRSIALGHWYLWCVWQVTPGWVGAVTIVLGALERMMQPETAHRLALARNSYWQEMRDTPCHTIDKRA